MIEVALEHIPVLLDEAIELLAIKPGGTYLDCTVGLGGHTERILDEMQGKGLLIALDRDSESLQSVSEDFRYRSNLVSFHHENFKNLPLVLTNLGIENIDGCLVDLGVSRYQLTHPDRGFTFTEEGPLDMRMDRDQQTTAEDLVNHLNEPELADIFRRYGEEPQARKIARAIVEQRQHRRIKTTTELADLVRTVKTGRRNSRIHPATLVFQALRIEVNQELQDLDRFLTTSIQFLRPRGRLVVISFHSLEDRIVKKTFQLEAGRCICFRPWDLCECPRRQNVRILTRKPIGPSENEVSLNPSARSAKLRAVERIEIDETD
jgi:16S rRNA (cytosine1402-N4)-methyltransferase